MPLYSIACDTFNSPVYPLLFVLYLYGYFYGFEGMKTAQILNTYSVCMSVIMHLTIEQICAIVKYMIIKILFLVLVFGLFAYAKAKDNKTQVVAKKKTFNNRNEKGQFIQVFKKKVVAYRYILVNDYKKGSYMLKVKNNFI